MTVFHGWREEISPNCCECKLVSKENFYCVKCNRVYHAVCWPKREVKNDENGEIIGCSICIKRGTNSKKRKSDELMRKEGMNENEFDTEVL